MSQSKPQPESPTIQIATTPDYREGYANSVQVRLSVWDFLLTFGTIAQNAPDAVEIRNFQGVYLSPQQAKALCGLLTHNLAQYEQAFGTISLEPGQTPVPLPTGGPIH